MSPSVHFLQFLFKWKGVKLTSMSNEKYAENEISNSSSHQKKREKKTETREEQKHIQLQIH